MQLTTNFHRKEFDCKDGTQVPSYYLKNLSELANNLQVLRNEINKPITITSGWRTHSHNDKINGKPSSFHLTAKAADITVPDMKMADLKKVIERLIMENRMKPGGLKAYKTFVHYDIRGYRATW